MIAQTAPLSMVLEFWITLYIKYNSENGVYGHNYSMA
jgi:hypothetical protein